MVDDREIGRSIVFYNEKPTLPEGITPDNIFKEFNGIPSEDYDFSGWIPSLDIPITTAPTQNGVFVYEAQFVYKSYIKDSWETIIEACKNGDIS